MSELDLSNEVFDPSSWENLDEGQIKDELSGLIKRINNVSALLEKMVADSDYDNTEKYFTRLITEDLSMSGFVRLFYTNNKTIFGDYKDENSAPPWYGNLPAQQKKYFDECHRYFLDAVHLVEPIELLGRAMSLIPLEASFKYQESVLNFGGAGFTEDLYQKINDDMTKINELFKLTWSGLNRNAVRSARYYRENVQKLSSSAMEQGYREARKEDYKFEIEVRKLNQRFFVNNNGTVSVEPGFHADMKIIDKYLSEIIALGNIEDSLNKSVNDFPKISEQLNAAYNNVKQPAFRQLVDALFKLKDTLYDYAEAGIHVFQSYKNRDTDSPYCFVRKLPAFSSMTGQYGLYARSSDPWHDGTDFYNLYKDAAMAIEEQYQQYVYQHGVLNGES